MTGLAQKQIETVQLLHKLKVGDETPGSVILRALRFMLEKTPMTNTDADMRAFGASDAACYKWPEDTAEHKALRSAYIEGAAACGPNQKDNPVNLAMAKENLNLAANYIDKLTDKDAAIKRGLNAISAKFPKDLTFANAGFTLSVVDTVVRAVLGPRTEPNYSSDGDRITPFPKGSSPLRNPNDH